MNPALLAAVPSAVSAVGSFFGQRQANRTNVRLAREAMDFSSAQAQREMDFQERMSGTAYQRAVKDMRLAGINPIVAYAQGGASTPGGASGSGVAPRVEDAVGPAVASAMHAKRLQADLKILSSQADSAAAVAREREAIASREEARNYWYTRIGSDGKLSLDYRMPGLGQMVGAEIESARALARLNSVMGDLRALEVPEREALAKLYDKIGAGGAGARTFLPLLIEFLRRK